MGHLKDTRPVLDAAELQKGNRVEIDKNWIVETNTGMSCVIPAWKISEALYSEELMKMRKELDEELQREKAATPVSFDVAEAEEMPFTQQDFNIALNKVTRKVKPE
jgi:hypothetical protein